MYVEVRILTNNDINQAITQILKRHRPDMWSFDTTYYSKCQQLRTKVRSL